MSSLRKKCCCGKQPLRCFWDCPNCLEITKNILGQSSMSFTYSTYDEHCFDNRDSNITSIEASGSSSVLLAAQSTAVFPGTFNSGLGIALGQNQTRTIIAFSGSGTFTSTEREINSLPSFPYDYTYQTDLQYSLAPLDFHIPIPGQTGFDKIEIFENETVCGEAKSCVVDFSTDTPDLVVIRGTLSVTGETVLTGTEFGSPITPVTTDRSTTLIVNVVYSGHEIKYVFGVTAECPPVLPGPPIQFATESAEDLIDVAALMCSHNAPNRMPLNWWGSTSSDGCSTGTLASEAVATNQFGADFDTCPCVPDPNQLGEGFCSSRSSTVSGNSLFSIAIADPVTVVCP